MIYCNYPKNCQTLTELDISPWRLTAIQSSLCDTIIGNFCCYFRHYPIGVLFDLYGSSASLPWNLTVHFQVMKVVSLPPCNNNNTIVLRMWSAICWKGLFPHVGVVLRLVICTASLLDHCLRYLNLLLYSSTRYKCFMEVWYFPVMDDTINPWSSNILDQIILLSYNYWWQYYIYHLNLYLNRNFQKAKL